jgi:hypothetical protein
VFRDTRRGPKKRNKSPRPERADRGLYEKRWNDHRLMSGKRFQATAPARYLREKRIALCRAYHARLTRLDECLRLRDPSGIGCRPFRD